MTEMPELVAAMHSLVGLAAVFVGFNAHIELGNVLAMEATRPAKGWKALPLSTAVAKKTPVEHRHPAHRAVPRHLHRRHHLHRLGDCLWQAGGQGDVCGGQAARRSHAERGGGCHLGAVLIWYIMAGGILDAGHHDHRWLVHRLSPDHGHRRGRHAGGGVDAQLLFGLGCGGHRLHAGQRPADRGRRAGGLVRCDPVLHHVQGHEPLVRLGHPRRLRRRECCPRAMEIEGEQVAIDADGVAAALDDADSVIIVPGYGMAVAQAQQNVRTDPPLRAKGKEVRFAIHPVAGRLPGHMNVLLAEAKVPYDIVLEMDEINEDFPDTDVVIVIGSNDIVNPSRRTTRTRPSPACRCWKCGRPSRCSCPSAARARCSAMRGIENPLFYKENTRMFYGDAKATVCAPKRLTGFGGFKIDGKVGYYALAVETAMTAGTWEAAKASCAVAQTAQRLVAGGERTAFALCRPPGHHAAIDMYGGYCFLNNAAITAQMFLDDGAKRVAVLDVDFHHGNGTQDIFYERSDVLFCSLHGQPEDAFPHFLGYKDETGAGKGEGFNVNYPMPPGTPYSRWSKALKDAIKRIKAYGPDALVISLGVDAYKDDPISFFKLDNEDFTDCGRQIAKLKLPTLFVMEGGYAIAEIGVNTVNVLDGFMNR
jgi:acetoin utilization deacetylase AcuC-like enzyme